MKLRTPHLAGLVATAAVGTVIVLAYLTVWQLVIYGMLSCLSGVLGIVLVLATILVWLRRRAEESPGFSKFGTVLFLVGIFLLVQVAYLPVGRGLRDMEVKRAQDYICALIPKLEEYERLHDEYPASVDSVLIGDEEAPRLLQLNGDSLLRYDNRQYYVRQGETYGFRFYLPDGFIGYEYEYCCGAAGVWTVTD
jgi:hypothetical protein